MLRVVQTYCAANPRANEDTVFSRIERLRGILNNSLGLIELNADLDVETVSEIFVRINSQGVSLNAADFAMSKMAANERYNGHQLRKCIDYFCHLAIAPEAYENLARDNAFSGTRYFHAMEWLKHEKDDLYDPSYTDMLRVAFTSEFGRGRLDDLVALLSGRNFETREFEEAIAEDSFRRLEAAVLRFMNETNFKRFTMILRSAGFVNSSLIRSQNTVNFAYILYLTLRARHTHPAHIETLVRRWFVMSILTGRYTGSPETAFGLDIRNIGEQNAEAYLDTVERAELSDAFWNVGLPLQMDTSVSSSPYFNVFLASQVKGNDKGFLASDHTVQNLLEGFSHTWLSGTSHPQHIFESYGVSARMGHPAMGASRMPISCALIWRLTAYPKVWMKLGSMTTTGFCSGAGALWPRRSGTTTRDCKGRHRRPRRRLRLTCADLPTANTATP